LGVYLRRKKKAAEVERKKSYIVKYIPHMGEALKEILELSEKDSLEIQKLLKQKLESPKENK